MDQDWLRNLANSRLGPAGLEVPGDTAALRASALRRATQALRDEAFEATLAFNAFVPAARAIRCLDGGAASVLMALGAAQSRLAWDGEGGLSLWLTVTRRFIPEDARLAAWRADIDPWGGVLWAETPAKGKAALGAVGPEAVIRRALAALWQYALTPTP